MQKIVALFLVAFALALASVTAAHAQLANRTWVSGVGEDTNPCSRTAPCKTFASAISKTAASGEISVLDPGAYGTFTITKSISIVSDGLEAGVLACGVNGNPGFNGITINAAATDVIALRGLTIEGCNSGLIGIRVLSAGSVLVQKTLIRGFLPATSAGISITPSAAAVKVIVSETTISRNKNGIIAAPTGAGSVAVTVDRSVINDSKTYGIRAEDNATVRLSNSVISGNNKGISAGGSGVIASFENNVIAGNDTDGSPTAVLPLH